MDSPHHLPRSTDLPGSDPNWKPISKVAGGVPAGTGVAIVLVWALRQFGVDMPAEVAMAIAGILAGLGAYVVPSRRVVP